jgi:hypothetical protein
LELCGLRFGASSGSFPRKQSLQQRIIAMSDPIEVIETSPKADLLAAKNSVYSKINDVETKACGIVERAKAFFTKPVLAAFFASVVIGICAALL